MESNLYNVFDEIFSVNNKMLEYTEQNINLLQKNVLENTLVKKYGKNAMYGGYFCHSLILEATTSGFKKGKLFNSIPKGKNSYDIYELDKNNQLLRIQEITENEIGVEHYIIKSGDIEYCIGMSGKKKCTYSFSSRAIYIDNMIKQYDIIQGDSLWSEQYEYEKDKIICKQYYYVPKVKNSEKIKLFIIHFTMDENKKVNWLEHGEYKDGKVEITYKYNK